MNHPKATLYDVLRITAILKQNPGIRGVEIFGSVARTGSGNDLDILLVVDDETAQSFMARATEHIRRAIYLSDVLASIEEWAPEVSPIREPREQATIEILGDGFAHCIDEARAYLQAKFQQPPPIDLFLVPLRWREQISNLERGFPQGDREFWNNVARDAQPLPSREGQSL
jgi:predicted nucleotidyltransferase